MNYQLFDRNGQINANSVSEAMQVISKMASIVQNNNLPSNFGLTSPSMSEDQRDALLAKAIFTQEGKLALAQTMANPI